jgi:hypothetical protein
MVVVTQPEPRAWIGEPGADGRRETVAFALPAGARDVQFRAGADACCTIVREGRAVVTQPLLPGETTYDFHYQLPATGAATRWSRPLLYPTARLLLMAPTDSVALSSDDLALTQETMADGKTLAVAELTEQPAGRQLALRLALTAGGAPPPVSHRVVLSTWWWSALGGLVLVLYCLWQWWRSRPATTPEPPTDDLLAFLVSQIAELDHAYLTNQVSRQYYGTARANLKRQLAARLVTPDHDQPSPQHPSPA